jgi:hypothetical protein
MLARVISAHELLNILAAAISGAAHPATGATLRHWIAEAHRSAGPLLLEQT